MGRWNGNSNVLLEELVYKGTSTKVSDGRLQFYMNTNGNVGGITAFNATTGALNSCVSGNWFLANNSEAIGVGTGGIIGMNESEKDLSFLVNGAFVGRKIKSAGTDRFAGGIIGNQNNSTSSDWTISDCVNYGTVYCYNSDYSGGIMGQWTGTGGTIGNVGTMEICRRLTKRDGLARRVVLWHSYIMPMRTMSIISSAVETMETCTRERDLAETERTIVQVF